MGSARAQRIRRHLEHPRLRALDGSHPFKDAVPRGYVDYPAKRIRGASVAYFNFPLAKEMGLLADDHPDSLTPSLRKAIVDTFAIQIVNEYDQRRKVAIPASERMPGTYMATRYLQLQHPAARVRQSGDGRSVWNGTTRWRGTTWDVSSCGTGVTRLCPATAWSKRFYKTGSRVADYGCGTAGLDEGLAAALMSETFHRNRIQTERVLAVLSLPNGFAINVRAARNLIRPSHFFVHAKASDLESLRAVASYFVERQVQNGALPRSRGFARWTRLANEISRAFAIAAATFESEYIFVWMDWDGDNVLADGGIIDYGSVRQFGLYHREYRFDDGPRWSTTIPEQRRMARLIVQNFAQIRDYLATGRKRPLADYDRDPVLSVFDTTFEEWRLRLLLRKVGFAPEIAEVLLSRRPGLVRRFRREHSWFEQAKSARGPRKVEDGITWNAVYSTRDLLRELPARALATGTRPDPREVLGLAASTYASRRDRRPTPTKLRHARELERLHFQLIRAAASLCAMPFGRVLEDVSSRSAVLNRYARITGDAATYAVDRLLRDRRRLSADEVYRIIHRFVHAQILVPEEIPRSGRAKNLSRGAKEVFDEMLSFVAEYRHGL
jgi:uncharacterized protein YdiU (UPF0061 family)